MIGVIRGDNPAGLLFIPRMDIWYNYNKVRGTLPVGFEQLSLCEVATKLGVGFHSVVPDFIRSAPPEAIHHRALGFYNNPDFPYIVDFSAVDYEVEISENEMRVVYHDILGDLTTRCSYGCALLESGSSIPDILEHAVKNSDDYLTLVNVLSKVRIIANPDGYTAYHDRIGDDGLAVAFLSLAAGPMQHIMRDLRKYESFCLDLYDFPKQVSACVEALAVLYEKIIDSVLETEAEVVLFGANYDDTITYAPFFEEHITPWLNKAGERLHRVGKYLLTHTDGENQGLLSTFEECNFDIADSVCPAPMTKVSLQEYREAFGVQTTIWGGIPSQIMLKSCCSDTDFKDFVANVISSCKPYNNLILSIADTTPPDAEFDRILYLIEQCKNTIEIV